MLESVRSTTKVYEFSNLGILDHPLEFVLSPQVRSYKFFEQIILKQNCFFSGSKSQTVILVLPRVHSK